MSSYTGSTRPTKRFTTTTPASQQHNVLFPERAQALISYTYFIA